MKAETFDFSKALLTMKNTVFVKRKVVKNDTAICTYKNRLYHINTKTGIRYAYSPTNADIHAEDWQVYQDTI